MYKYSAEDFTDAAVIIAKKTGENYIDVAVRLAVMCNSTDEYATATSSTPSTPSTSSSFTQFVLKNVDVEVGDALFEGKTVMVSGDWGQHVALANSIPGIPNSATWQVQTPVFTQHLSGNDMGVVLGLLKQDDVTIFLQSAEQYDNQRGETLTSMKQVEWSFRIDMTGNVMKMRAKPDADNSIREFMVSFLNNIKTAGLKATVK